MRVLLLLLFALPLCAEDTPMRYYVMATLEKSPQWTKESTSESKKLLQGHFNNVGRLEKEEKLILAGPLIDAEDAAGVFLLHTESVEEAREWCSSDTAIAAGRFRVALWNWYSAKGIGILSAAAK